MLGNHRVIDAADVDRQPITVDLHEGDVLFLGGILGIRFHHNHLFTAAYELGTFIIVFTRHVAAVSASIKRYFFFIVYLLISYDTL